MRTGLSLTRQGNPALQRRASRAGACALAVLVAPFARADEPPRAFNTYEVTPFVGYMAGGEFKDAVDGSKRDVDSAVNFGVILNAAADYWRHYELLYSRQSTRLGGAAPFDMDVQYLQIGGTVSYPEAVRFIPYFGLTIGATQFSPGESGLSDETKFSFTVGGGMRVPITDHIGVRFDARAFITVLNSDTDFFCVSSGGATCAIRTKSDTFLQYAAALGVIVGF